MDDKTSSAKQTVDFEDSLKINNDHVKITRTGVVRGSSNRRPP